MQGHSTTDQLPRSSEAERWAEYERRKSQLKTMALTPCEYDRQIKRILRELQL